MKSDGYKQPKFLYTPSFPRLTINQRDLLFKLVRITDEEGAYMGEFWWRSDPNEPNIITQIKPINDEGNFDPENQMFKNINWKWIAELAQMETLERFNYIVMSKEKEYGSNKEKWRKFCVTQLGFDFFTHANHCCFMRFTKLIWEKSENQLLALFFGLLGGILVELIMAFLMN